jgi:hypothetical protein
VIVELSSMVTLVKRSKRGANALSEPTTSWVAPQNSFCKKATNFGVWRCSIACGVTSTPHWTAI